MNSGSSRDRWQPARALQCPRPVAALGCALCLAMAGLNGSASAYDPQNGEWTKTDPTDLRVMAYNVLDGIASDADKTNGFNQWDALVRTVAALRPDVLMLEETGDTATAPPGDTVSQLETVVDLFLHGGVDPFQGGTVTSYVQLYAPDFDMPYVYVNSTTDGYNRNTVLSRYPFADLNGDTKSTYPNTPYILPDAYAPGGTGGIRGFGFVELDLPNGTYIGDVVIGFAHLKAGGNSSDYSDRLTAAQNVAYYIDYLYNGAGTGTPDPNNKITDSPAAATILPSNTPVILGGDWNEDEDTNGRRGPAAWLTQAATSGGTDGTDRDRTDMTYDDAREPFSNSRKTQGSSSKLDYIAWQDSITTPRDTFIFDSSKPPTNLLPPELATYTVPSLVSNLASDHLPIIADFIMPAQSCTLDSDCDDGQWCTGVETCNGFNQCVDGTPPCPRIELCQEAQQTCLECVDDSDCSAPLAHCRVSDNTCVECTTNAHCDDGDPCNGIEACLPDNTCDSSVLAADCNGNMIEDSCDIDSQTSADCNHNSAPDECDIADLTSSDCDANQIPDECEPDCNANGIADECDLTDETSLDCNNNTVPDECDIAGGTSEDCNVNGVPDECDIASGAELDANGNGIPDSCEGPLTVPDPILVDPGPPGSRYLTFSAPPTAGASLEEVIRITFVNLNGFSIPSQPYLYVGVPYDAPEEESDAPGLTFRAAPLTCGPVFHNWPAEGTISVYAAELVPMSTYEVQRANTSCTDLSNEACWSTAAVMQTGVYADAAPPFDQPDGPVQPDFSDVAGLVSKFLADPSAPVKAIAQIQPNIVFPSRPIDFRDISDAVNAFLGIPYDNLYSGPCDCPSIIPCGLSSCSQDADCFGGLCIDSFCRDRCGRCSTP